MILSALNDYYQHLIECGTEGIAPFGYSYEQISYVLVISSEGKLLAVDDNHDVNGKKLRPKQECVPKPAKRASNITPNFLWDKTSYVLGVSANAKARNKKEHQAFKDFHKEALENTTDPALQAVVKFLSEWEPDNFFESSLFNKEMLDTNMVFRFENDQSHIHERPIARQLRAGLLEEQISDTGQCLVSGKKQSLARLHPSIKGVKDAQSSGASIISFNKSAFTSYHKEQGSNAPVSIEAAFAYTTVLNYLLRYNSRQNLQIGDTSIVFWAQAESSAQTKEAEALFTMLLSPPKASDTVETGKLRSAITLIQKGKPLSDLNPDLEGNTRIFVLGLSPNASRLSIRFWETGSLNAFAKRLAQHYEDLWLEPAPWTNEPSVWQLVLETVPHRGDTKPKTKDVHPLLAGEVMRAILTGNYYPRMLLTAIIMRFRADGKISPLRVALCKAVLTRQQCLSVNRIEQEIPMSLDPNNTEPGYLLGRLFAELENAQKAASGKGLNATIRDRYYGAASATPANLFPVLLRNTQNHLAKLRKGDDKSKAIAWRIEHNIQDIVDGLGPSFPKNMNIESQGHFAIGYYHQSKSRFNKPEIVEEGE